MRIEEQTAGPDPFKFMDRYISTARHMLGFGADTSDIHSKLLKDGATEEQAYLAWKAAKVLDK